MSIFGWLIVGLIEGFVASRIADDDGAGFFIDLLLGSAGAVAGGLMFTSVGTVGLSGFNLFSMVVALLGAVIVLIIYHALINRSL
jgi:uncharacterized membrane protein YeaQ/YmgE (transglycosylase-associated protein family)